MLGVALFGSLVGGDNAFIAGAHTSLVISAAVLLAAAVAIWHGRADMAKFMSTHPSSSDRGFPAVGVKNSFCINGD